MFETISVLTVVMVSILAAERVIMHIIEKIKTSKCCGAVVELKDSS